MLEKFKARLDTPGFGQVHATDYNKSFAPVVKFTTICLFLATVAVEDLELHLTHLTAAFPDGGFVENMFI